MVVSFRCVQLLLLKTEHNYDYVILRRMIVMAVGFSFCFSIREMSVTMDSQNIYYFETEICSETLAKRFGERHSTKTYCNFKAVALHLILIYKTI